MTQRLFFREDPRKLRQRLHRVFDKADEILAAEKELVALLHDLEQDRLYHRLGYKSLRGFCTGALKLSKPKASALSRWFDASNQRLHQG